MGNLKDITLRALDALKEVELILAEDTRTTSNLLNHYQITKPLSPYHQHNEHKILQHLIDQLSQGKKWPWSPMPARPEFLILLFCWYGNA
jgi:16S rRNA (cytidine1402-2'-O)-methyltransferase